MQKQSVIRPLKDRLLSKVPKYSLPFMKKAMTTEEASEPAIVTMVNSAFIFPRFISGSRCEYSNSKPSPATQPI